MEPLVFEPYFRPQVWGDRRLKELLGKPLPAQGEFGESWEVSAHPQHVSRVAEGSLEGALLTDLCASHAAELFGEQIAAGFPLLVKLLDCNDWLSVQVHPNDVLARQLLGEANGKTEAWVVLEAEPGARVYAGLLPGTTRAKLERHLAEKTVDRCLYSFAPKRGDCLMIPAGTVHAAGGGVVLAEVQQTSDATFRLFDWNRLGSDGRPRQLHIAEALASIDWNAGAVRPVQRAPVRRLGTSGSVEHLVRCQYFHLDRFHLDDSVGVPFTGRLSIWILENGAAELQSTAGGYRRVFRRGETVLVPASAAGLSWHPVAGTGAVILLGIHLP